LNQVTRLRKREKEKREMMTINVAKRSFYKSMTYEMMDIKEEKKNITKCFFSFHLF
jgi:metal-responsive CopG/Arc/MetJ family transcriptional regulator